MSDLRSDELRPAGGTWSGLLFENSRSSSPLTMSWSFTLDFEVVERDYGSASPSLSIEWVPAGSSSWRSMAGQSFHGRTFGDPIEVSLYFFEHHRLDRVDLTIVDQSSDLVTVVAVAGGDLDGLGLSEVSARASLRFTGIHVQTESTGGDTDAASALLAGFADLDGLRPRSRGRNVVFEPVG